MIRRQPFRRQNPLRPALHCRTAIKRSLLSLSLLSLLATGLTVSPVNAQYPSDGARFASDEMGSRIEFGFHQQEQPVASYDPGLEPVIQEVPPALDGWGYGTGFCCGDCPPVWRVRADGLLLNYEGSGMTLSNEFFLGEFGYEEGGRVSLVRQLDCLDAWELAYVGPYEWNEFGQVTGVGLASRLASTTVNLSEFNNATFHSQSYRSQFHSVEANRRWYGWDVISTLVGIRYINVDEDYLFNSTGPVSTGSLAIETNNHMAGPQIGAEFMFPIGNWMTTTSIKGALMANGTDGNLRLVNAGAVEVANSDDNVELASIVELGYFFSYQITPRVKFRGGYEFWWLYGVAVVPGQLTNPVTARTGSHVDGNSDVYYHGATAGVEIVW